MANIGDVNDTEFQTSVLDSETPVLVDFWAEWCVPCHMVSPVVEEIGQEKGQNLKVAKLNIDENPDATRTYGVMSIPSLILFKAGKEVAPAPRVGHLPHPARRATVAVATRTHAHSTRCASFARVTAVRRSRISSRG
jgi:thioredoxin 1